MKVLFLNYEYPPIGGGASTATEAILKEWATRSTGSGSSRDSQIEAHLITSGVGEAYEHIRLGGEVYVHRVPIGKNPEKLHSQSAKDILVYSWKAFWFARTLIREEHTKQRFDATLAFFTVPCGFIAYILKLCYGIPYAVSLRGADVPGFSEKYDAFSFFLKLLVRFLWKRSIAVIPNSVGITELAKKTSEKQSMTIIENGVDTRLFCPLQEPKPDVPVIFLSTSRLTPRKGIDTLIRAFADAVKRLDVPMELHIVGEGEQRKTLEQMAQELGIAEQTRFIGRVEHNQLPDVYRSAHVFVLPSKNEGMSNSALEALACGLPLIVSGTGGMQELVSNGSNGFFVDPNDTEAFADALLKFATDRDIIAAYGLESRRRAEARGWNTVAGRFRDVIAERL
jgi:glycosyltransferase involved in cell wall biosynthesis